MDSFSKGYLLRSNRIIAPVELLEKEELVGLPQRRAFAQAIRAQTVESSTGVMVF
ncbi:MAG TPA: hypothetical protein VLA72_10525 [Anaerolineales bacterium]|nr:hypothetical protein [Anaerolineales bacterium]